MPFKPLGQTATVSRPILPGGSIGGLKFVNPADRARELGQEESIKNAFDIKAAKQKSDIGIQTKIKEAEQAPLSGDLSAKYNSSVSMYGDLSELKDYIMSKPNNVFIKGFGTDPIINQLSENIVGNLALLRSGAGVSDKERARIQGLESKFSDLVLSLAQGKSPQAVAINKLATIAAEARSYSRTIGKQNVFLEDVKLYRQAKKDFIGLNDTVSDGLPIQSQPEPKVKAPTTVDYRKLSDEDFKKLYLGQ